VKWIVSVCAVACAIACALSSATAFAQQPRDPLIQPQEGGDGSRFQIVGQFGWTPGETVTIRLGFTAVDPLNYGGPFYHERTATVLRDGTWSFPIAVNDDLFPFPLGDDPRYIVVEAESATKTATNAFIYAPGGREPQGAEAIAHLGFGPPRGTGIAVLTAALFLIGTGTLLVVSGGFGRQHRSAGR
jgi:hypothetical protein